MDQDFVIKTGDDGFPYQTFQGVIYKLYPRERYFSKHKWRMHWKVWEYFNGQIPKGFHVHHKDENPWNNKLENLELIAAKKHLSSHAKQRVIDNPQWLAEFQKKGIEKAPEWHSSDEGKEWHKQHAKKYNFGHITFGNGKCDECGSEYLKKKKSQKFCHANCKARANRRSRKARGI